MGCTKSGPIPRKPPRRTPPKKTDWLCSKCGQVSNSSEPCYDCDRKERDANPIPPPPPAPCRPTRDTSRKPYIKPNPKRTHWSERQPSCTPFTKGWPQRPTPPPLPPYGPTRDSSRKSFESEPNWLWQAILSFIDWLIGSVDTKEYETLLVKKHKGIQVKHLSRYLFWVGVVVGFDENDEPILDSPELTVSQWDSDGNRFHPDGLFEIQKKSGKIDRIPYEWQPVAQKHKTNGRGSDIIRRFFDAQSAFNEMYGEFDIPELLFMVSSDVYQSLINESIIVDAGYRVKNWNDCSINSILGVHLGEDVDYEIGQCVLMCRGNKYHFEILTEPRKTNGEQMATLAELFEGYEDDEEHPDWKLACAMDRHFEGKIEQEQKIEEEIK